MPVDGDRSRATRTQQGRALQPGWSLAAGWGGFLTLAGLLPCLSSLRCVFPPCAGSRCRRRWCTIGDPVAAQPLTADPGFCWRLLLAEDPGTVPVLHEHEALLGQRHRPTAVTQNPAGARGHFSLSPVPLFSLSAPNSAGGRYSYLLRGLILALTSLPSLCPPCQHVLCLLSSDNCQPDS